MQLKIGLSYAPSDNPKTKNYINAIRHAAERAGHELEVVDLFTEPERLREMDAVVFTGGADIAPSRFGKAAEEHLVGEVNEARDASEFETAKKASDLRLPVLGICRGLQLLNVVHGGSLITDIQHFGGSDHKKLDETTDNRHRVKVTPGTHIYKILRETDGEVNSAHHQAIERLGEGLAISSRDERDGTIESIEWEKPEDKPYMLAVQWHPERMGYDEPFAGRLFDSFIWEVSAHKLLRDRLMQNHKPAVNE
jgi:putative glutamine amidotransferase